MKKNLLLISFLLLILGCNTSLFTNKPKKNSFKFGIIADIQYADKDTRKNGKRSYRKSIDNLRQCVEELNRQKPDFVIQLGDIIDGNKNKEKTLSDLDDILEVFNKLDMPKYHVVGNHCLNAGKQELQEKLGLNSLYYDFTVPEAPEWRFVVLNGNDAGYGVIGDKQLEWLKSRLEQASSEKEKVIVFSHFPLNFKKDPTPVLKLISNCPAVVAYFAGHHHGGGYVNQNGVHFVTVKGMVEQKDDNAFAIIEVSPGLIKEKGFGKEPSRDMKIASMNRKGDGMNKEETTNDNSEIKNSKWPGKKSSFHGFDQYNFNIDDLQCRVVVPKENAKGKPWIWRARFWGHEPQTDVALLNKGFHVVYVDVGGLFGAPKAVERWDKFYKYLTESHGFDKKVVLEGMSRGGLIIFNWAAANPEKVYCIYADAPVCDFKSWPGGKGKSKGAPNEWKQCVKVYGLTEEEALKYKGNPIDNLKPLAKAGIPLLHVVGDADATVPVSENTSIVEERYKSLGGTIEVIHKERVGHHPHSLKDPKIIVDFILKFSGR